MRLLFLFITTLASFASPFSDYWYGGKAEIAVYDLQQSRYGELRSGTTTLISVAEPFSKSKQVKLDYPDQAGEDNASVFKLNTVKKYNTGIYPYSIMTSSFTDITTGQLYKANTSIQEWCGQTFLQANAQGKDQYLLSGYSYFESEGDQKIKVNHATFSEEIIPQIRLKKLTPETSKLNLYPSQETLRLLHLPITPVKATLNWQVGEKDTKVQITYNHPLQLTTNITFSSLFPYAVQSWSESYTKEGQTNTSTATLKSINLLPYWEMNSRKFDHMRTKIGL